MISAQSEKVLPRTNTRKRQPFTDTRGAPAIFHSSATTFDRGCCCCFSSTVPLSVHNVLDILFVFLCVYILSCYASTTHSHTHIYRHLICTVTHKHNHRQRCNLLCNFFLHIVVFCCLAKLIFQAEPNHQNNQFTFSNNSSPAKTRSANLVCRESHFTHSLSCNHHLQRAGKSP